MGWISRRHMSRSGGLNRTPSNNGSQRGPLRKIVDLLAPGQTMFERDWVRFECGHEGFATQGAVRGRCRPCRHLEEAKADPLVLCPNTGKPHDWQDAATTTIPGCRTCGTIKPVE